MVQCARCWKWLSRYGLRLAVALVGLGLGAVLIADDLALAQGKVRRHLSGTAWVFSHAPTDIANVTGVIPLGNLNPGGGHTLAVDHMYLNYPVPNSNGAYAYPVYAMGDGTLVAVFRAQTAGKPDPDYQLFIAHTPQLTSTFDHVHVLSQRLQSFLAAVPDPAWIQMGSANRILLLGQLGAPAPLPVVAGEQLGVTKSYSSNWDVGVIDTRRQTRFEGHGALRYPTFVDYLQQLGVDAQPPFPGQKTINATCFIDYFRDELRTAWAELLTSTPRGCGRPGWDVPGKLRGAWFNPAIDAASPPPVFEVTSAAISIIPDNAAPTTRVQIGIASGSRFAAIDPTGSVAQLHDPFRVTMNQAPGARINPDPAQIGPASGTVCYDLAYQGVGPRYNSILFHMITDTSVAIKFDPTPYGGPQCGSITLAAPDPSWTTTYVR